MKVPVLIPRVFDHPFSYIAAENKNLKQGDLVIVPFGKNQEIGVVFIDVFGVDAVVYAMVRGGVHDPFNGP